MYFAINKWVISVKISNFSGQYLRKHWILDIGVLDYIVIVWLKEHSPEVRSFPPGTPCMYVCVLVCMNVNISVCMYVCTYVCTQNVFCMCDFMYMWMYVCIMYVCMYVRIFIHKSQGNICNTQVLCRSLVSRFWVLRIFLESECDEFYCCTCL